MKRSRGCSCVTVRRLGRAQFMDRRNQRPDPLGIDAGLDAVAEIEHMAGTGSKIGQNLRDLFADAFGSGI